MWDDVYSTWSHVAHTPPPVPRRNICPKILWFSKVNRTMAQQMMASPSMQQVPPNTQQPMQQVHPPSMPMIPQPQNMLPQVQQPSMTPKQKKCPSRLLPKFWLAVTIVAIVVLVSNLGKGGVFRLSTVIAFLACLTGLLTCVFHPFQRGISMWMILFIPFVSLFSLIPYGQEI